LDEQKAAERIIRAVEGHPLALELAGAYAVDARGGNLETIAAELENPEQVFVIPGDTPLAMARVFAQSLQTLPADVAHLFAALAAFPTGDFGRNAALEVAHIFQLDPEWAINLLVQRMFVHILTNHNMSAQSDRERLRFHPLLRAFATTQFQTWDSAKQEQ